MTAVERGSRVDLSADARRNVDLERKPAEERHQLIELELGEGHERLRHHEGQSDTRQRTVIAVVKAVQSRAAVQRDTQPDHHHAHDQKQRRKPALLFNEPAHIHADDEHRQAWQNLIEVIPRDREQPIHGVGQPYRHEREEHRAEQGEALLIMDEAVDQGRKQIKRDDRRHIPEDDRVVLACPVIHRQRRLEEQADLMTRDQAHIEDIRYSEQQIRQIDPQQPPEVEASEPRLLRQREIQSDTRQQNEDIDADVAHRQDLGDQLARFAEMHLTQRHAVEQYDPQCRQTIDGVAVCAQRREAKLIAPERLFLHSDPPFPFT